MFDAGMCKICELVNVALPGNRPNEKLREVVSCYYDEEKIGINRFYLAKKEGERVDMLISIWEDRTISSLNVCDIDGIQYRITMIQHGKNADELSVSTLSLERMEKAYEYIETT